MATVRSTRRPARDVRQFGRVSERRKGVERHRRRRRRYHKSVTFTRWQGSRRTETSKWAISSRAMMIALMAPIHKTLGWGPGREQRRRGRWGRWWGGSRRRRCLRPDSGNRRLMPPREQRKAQGGWQECGAHNKSFGQMVRPADCCQTWQQQSDVVDP